MSRIELPMRAAGGSRRHSHPHTNSSGSEWPRAPGEACCRTQWHAEYLSLEPLRQVEFYLREAMGTNYRQKSLPR